LTHFSLRRVCGADRPRFLAVPAAFDLE